jgi:hypothetical protein
MKSPNHESDKQLNYLNARSSTAADRSGASRAAVPIANRPPPAGVQLTFRTQGTGSGVADPPDVL